MPVSLPEEMAAVQQMATALQANEADVASRGGGAGFVASGRDILARLQAVESEQEALKAALKLKTAEEAELRKGMRNWYSEAVRIVKLAFRDRPEKWVEFGVKAKK